MVIAVLQAIPSDTSQSTNACPAKPHPIFPQREQEGMPALAASPLCHAEQRSGAESCREPAVTGDSLNSGTSLSCANNYRWKWAPGSSLSQDTLSPFIALSERKSQPEDWPRAVFPWPAGPVLSHSASFSFMDAA